MRAIFYAAAVFAGLFLLALCICGLGWALFAAFRT